MDLEGLNALAQVLKEAEASGNEDDIVAAKEALTEGLNAATPQLQEQFMREQSANLGITLTPAE